MRLFASTWIAGLVLPLLMALPFQAAGQCPTPCVRSESIVNAAGDELRKALESLEFTGNRLAPSSQGALKTIARAMKNQPPNAMLAATVRADEKLKPAQARAQAAARAKALGAALIRAGVPASQLRIGPAG